jgi:hypothetical protein
MASREKSHQQEMIRRRAAAIAYFRDCQCHQIETARAAITCRNLSQFFANSPLAAVSPNRVLPRNTFHANALRLNCRFYRRLARKMLFMLELPIQTICFDPCTWN